MATTATFDEREIRALLETVHWYHSFEIVPGIFTPGTRKIDAAAMLDRLFGLAERLEGRRVLEIGTWDGPYAFELEARGAEVVATDIQDPAATGFDISKQILSSTVEYVRTSVYDLDKHITGPFDIVLFKGIFYHLKHPLLAFEQIHRVLKPEGSLLFEGECFSHYAETVQNEPVLNRLRLLLLSHSSIPLALCYPGYFKDSSNWFIPNAACLRGWLTASGFEIQDFSTSFPRVRENGSRLRRWMSLLRSWRRLRSTQRQRAWGVARKLDQTPIPEHEMVQRK